VTRVRLQLSVEVVLADSWSANKEKACSSTAFASEQAMVSTQPTSNATGVSALTPAPVITLITRYERATKAACLLSLLSPERSSQPIGVGNERSRY
jgi:hypothetical protein